MKPCKICQTELDDKILNVKEEMYGMGDIFQYGQCPSCDCLQILDIPNNLSDYYPKSYHSHLSSVAPKSFKSIRRALKRKFILQHPNWLSPLVKLWLSSYQTFWVYRRVGIKSHHKVLDVGSAYGEKILELKSTGIENVMGVDLFVENDIYLDNKLFVKKGTIEDVRESYDIIIFHHSLEHMPDQITILKKAVDLLNEGGRILIRIPTVTSEAFRTYKEKWYQLDAPRHLYLHSHESFHRLAKVANLKIIDKWCDSSELQYLISEQYKMGIPMFSPQSYITNNKTSIFSPALVREFKRKAKIANKQLVGDQICFILSK